MFWNVSYDLYLNRYGEIIFYILLLKKKYTKDSSMFFFGSI